jgi:hypothetical protein
MARLITMMKDALRSPLFYAYWAVNLADKAATLLPPGTLTRAAGAALGALVTVVSLVLFFKVLRFLRDRHVRLDRRNAWDLFASLWLFRLRLAVAALPFAIVLIATGADKAIVEKYNLLVAAAPAESWAALLELLRAGGIWGVAFLVFSLIDVSGNGVIVAQGKSERSLRNAVTLIPRAAAAVAAFFSAEILVGVLGYAAAVALGPVLGAGTASLAVSAVTIPASALLQLLGMLYVGALYLRRAPAELRCAHAPESDPQPGQA